MEGPDFPTREGQGRPKEMPHSEEQGLSKRTTRIIPHSFNWQSYCIHMQIRLEPDTFFEGLRQRAHLRSGGGWA